MSKKLSINTRINTIVRGVISINFALDNNADFLVVSLIVVVVVVVVDIILIDDVIESSS